MTKLNEIKSIIDKAWSVKNDATGVYRAFKESVDAETAKITSSNKLTEEGKEVMLEKLKERKTVEALKLSKSQIDLYNDYLNQARKEADKVAFAKLTPTDKVKEERFDKQFAELKTKVMLSTPETGAKLLKEFVEATDDQYLVDKIRNDFADTVQPIIGTADFKVKANLSDLFEHTKYKARGAESVEAERLIDQIDGMKNSRFFGKIVEDNAKSLGKQAAMYINRPDEYFEANPDHMKMKTEMKTFEESILETEYEV